MTQPQATKPDRKKSELLTVGDVAKLLNVSACTVMRMAKRNQTPQPIRLGYNLVRWRSDEVRQWIDAGCPAVAPST